MSNWKQTIEAQIVVTDARGDYINQHSSVDSNMHYDSAETMRLLFAEIERLRAALDEIESYGGAQGLIAREALRDE